MVESASRGLPRTEEVIGDHSLEGSRADRASHGFISPPFLGLSPYAAPRMEI